MSHPQYMNNETTRETLKPPPIIGLSGGIGTGKSTVAKMFVSLGSILIDADAIVHELQAPGKPVLQEIVNRFGPETLNDDGTLNRKGLGAIVFRDETARHDLGKIVHPPVRRELLARVKRALGEDAALVIVDIPLLFESGQERGDPELKIQSTILVYADKAQQIQRQISRDDADREEAVRRIDSQMPIKEKVRLADFTIDNSGTILQTRAQVEKLFLRLSRQKEEQS
ncbi:dephospho-CoA kinase [Myxococcota bacterium]|nr:dephospho-CoA kinase [Myxococcota bacterium]